MILTQTKPLAIATELRTVANTYIARAQRTLVKDDAVPVVALAARAECAARDLYRAHVALDWAKLIETTHAHFASLLLGADDADARTVVSVSREIETRVGSLLNAVARGPRGVEDDEESHVLGLVLAPLFHRLTREAVADLRAAADLARARTSTN